MDNPLNKLIDKKKVEEILNYYGNIGDNGSRLEINDLNHYQLALTHESYKQACNNLLSSKDYHKEFFLNYIPESSNESLEYLGDAVLKGIMGRYLYMRFSGEREAFMTNLKQKLERNTMLHKFARHLGFKEYLLLSLEVENQTLLGPDRGRSNISYLEDSFEAFIGAIMEDFQEQGYIYAERFVINIFENIIDFTDLIMTNNNSKDSVQRYCQFNKWSIPKYITLYENGPIYRKIFTKIIILTDIQFSLLSKIVQKQIIQFNKELIEYYKTLDQDSYIKLQEISNSNSYVLSIGYAKKTSDAEQDCAKNALQNLNLSANY
jgi:ribonuclease-3